MSLIDHGAAIAFAVFVWWFATGAILWLDQRPRASYTLSLWIAGGFALAGLAAVAWLGAISEPWAAYAGFLAAIAVWGWHEMAFLMGAVTGPNRAPCPSGVRGLTRFRLAAGTLIWHELALAATLVLMIALSAGAANQVAATTFAVLFVMRLSTKLNIFFGVPNIADAFLPSHLAYLKTYFRRGPVTAFFALSMTGACILGGALAGAALGAETGFDRTAYALVFALAALGILEHGFLAMKLPDEALWRWALAKTPGSSGTAASPSRHRPMPAAPAGGHD